MGASVHRGARTLQLGAHQLALRLQEFVLPAPAAG